MIKTRGIARFLPNSDPRSKRPVGRNSCEQIVPDRPTTKRGGFCVQCLAGHSHSLPSNFLKKISRSVMLSCIEGSSTKMCHLAFSRSHSSANCDRHASCKSHPMAAEALFGRIGSLGEPSVLPESHIQCPCAEYQRACIQNASRIFSRGHFCPVVSAETTDDTSVGNLNAASRSESRQYWQEYDVAS